MFENHSWFNAGKTCIIIYTILSFVLNAFIGMTLRVAARGVAIEHWWEPEKSCAAITMGATFALPVATLIATPISWHSAWVVFFQRFSLWWIQWIYNPFVHMFCCIIWKLSRYILEFRDMNVMTCFYLWVGTTAYLQNEVLFRRRPLCWFCSSRDPGCWDLEYDHISTLAAWSPAQKLWNVKLDGDARSFAKHCGLSVVAAVTLMYVLHRWSSKLRLHTQRPNHLIHWDIATQQMPHVRLFQGFGDVLWFGAQFGPSRDLRMCLGTPAIWGASRKSHTWRSHRNILTTDNGPIFTPQCQPINHPCFFFGG